MTGRRGGRAVFACALAAAMAMGLCGACGPKEPAAKAPGEPVAVAPEPPQPPVTPKPEPPVPPVVPPVRPPGEVVAIKPPEDIPPVRKPRPKPVRLDGRDRKSLLAATKDDNPRVRAAAADALGRLDDLEALWPLVQLAARDKDRKVQEAAVGAILRLGPEPDGEVVRRVRKALLDRLPQADLRRKPLQEALPYLGERAGLSMQVHWNDLAFAGVSPMLRVSVTGRGVPIGVLACKLLVAAKPSKPVGFLWCDRWNFGTVEGLAKKKAAKLRRLRRREYSQSGQANREIWRKLCESIPTLRGERVALATAVSHISRSAGVRIQVDWKALQAVGVEVDTRVNGYRDDSRAGWALETILLRAGLGEIDYLIDNGTLIVSTVKALDALMAKSKPK